MKSVLGFEIDEQDRMWILDQGKIAGQKAEEGAIKLIVWDIKKHELIHHINFTEDIASRTRSFLNDIGSVFYNHIYLLLQLWTMKKI